MKHFNAFTAIVLFFVASTMFAQPVATKNWTEMNNFHEVMSRVFHPVEEGNLIPIKTWSETLVQKAEQLTLQPIPTEFNNAKILESIAKLQVKTKGVHKLVTDKASDAAITKALTQAHDNFHEIVGLCAGKSK